MESSISVSSRPTPPLKRCGGVEGSLDFVEHRYFVYILTNPTHTVLYVGMTNDIWRRIDEHRRGIVEGFTKKYNVKKLVYVEETDYVNAAIEREKQIKKWRRAKKEALIATLNPEWNDLFATLV